MKAACINSCSNGGIPILWAISFHCFTEVKTSFNILFISDWFNLKKSPTLIKGKLEVDLSNIKLNDVPDEAIADYLGQLVNDWCLPVLISQMKILMLYKVVRLFWFKMK